MQYLKAFIFVLLTTPAIGQIEPRLFEFGPTAGLNLSYFNTPDTVTLKQKPSFGLKGGIFTRFNLGKFSIQPEFIYQAKGASLKEPLNNNFTYRYLSTPILVGYSPLKYIYVEAGWERNWALNQAPEDPVINKPLGPDLTDDQSLIIGARTNLLDIFSLFSVSVRYIHGLNNTTMKRSGNIPLDFRNRSIQVSASYTFSEQLIWDRKFGQKKKKN